MPRRPTLGSTPMVSRTATGADRASLLGMTRTTLPERTAALSEWCQGFLLGLVSGGIAEDSQLPDDVSELIQDFTEISRAGFELGSASEEDEDAFAQITEYVRVGVLLINEELQPLKAPPRLQ